MDLKISRFTLTCTVYLSLSTYIFLSVFLSISLSIFHSGHLSSLPIYIFPKICLSFPVSISVRIFLSFPLYIYLSFSPAFHLSLCLISKRERESQRKIFVGGRPAFQISNKDAISSIPKNHISCSFTPSRHIREKSRVVRKKNLETMSAGCLFHKIED